MASTHPPLESSAIAAVQQAQPLMFPSNISFQDAAGQMVVTIELGKHPRVVLAPGVKWDHASKTFWRDVNLVAPVCGAVP